MPSEESDSDLECQISDVDTNKRDVYINAIAAADDLMKKDDKVAEFDGSLAKDKKNTSQQDKASIEKSLNKESSVHPNEISQNAGSKDESKRYVRGHRRVLSSPPQISITAASVDALASQMIGDLRTIKSADGLVRSSSDTDVFMVEKQATEKEVVYL